MADAPVKWWSQQPFTVTTAHVAAPWNGFRDGRMFRCNLCGHFFIEGDVARLVMGVPHIGNPFVCAPCDGDDVRERLVAAYEEGATRFWWAFDPQRCPSRAKFIADRGNPESPGGDFVGVSTTMQERWRERARARLASRAAAKVAP